MKLLIALAAVAAVVAARPGYSSYDSAISYDGHGAGYAGYHGPAAPLAHDGRVVETPEVAHAKAAHLAAHAEAAAKASWGAPADEEYGYGHSGHVVGYAAPAAYGEHSAHAGHGYHGPPAPLDHKGRVIDTPDVAHLKAAHLAAHAEALANAHHSGGYEGEGYYGDSAEHGFAHGAGHAYHGPPAPLAHDGRVVDTPEVAHAKAAHLAAHAAASDAYGHGYYHGYAPAPAAYNKW
ncbi:pupal cuticle protein-like [Neodiprion lecontei]|uniref:Pupal cuticle protein-like n=1 Tax=Neodiprion lecontei TaxID=441921 RepID=A0ABM3FZ53_NEOLC|nr:pupal cuticle protein-like [Neodiprion lecontei]